MEFELVFIDADKAGYTDYLGIVPDAGLLGEPGLILRRQHTHAGPAVVLRPAVGRAAWPYGLQPGGRCRRPDRAGHLSAARRAGSPDPTGGNLMRITVLDPIGAEITELPLPGTDDATVAALRSALAGSVVVFPGETSTTPRSWNSSASSGS